MSEISNVLANLHRHRKLKDLELSWLIAHVCETSGTVVLGCKVCISALQEKTITLPHRYRDPAKSNCFAHGNVKTDFVRAVATHPACKMHRQALGEVGVVPHRVRAELHESASSKHTFAAVRHLLRLHAWSHFTWLQSFAVSGKRQQAASFQQAAATASSLGHV